MPHQTDDEKRALRAEVRERRAVMSEPQRDAAADGIREQLDALVDELDAQSLACYLSTPAEPGTREFVTGAVGRGIRVLLPISRVDGLLDWAAATSDGILTDGLFGLPEPAGPPLGPRAADDVDLLIVPAAAVDRQGMRMGWGRGYYDRAIGSLTRRPPVFAVVYDSELVDDVPCESHDQPVTGIVTPTRIVRLSPERR